MRILLATFILLCCCLHCGAALALDDTPLQNSYRLPRADGRLAPTPAPARRAMVAAGMSLAPALQASADLPAGAPRAARRKALARPAPDARVGPSGSGLAAAPAPQGNTGLVLR